MMTIRAATLSLLTAALLAACGGGEPTIPGSGAPAGAPTTKGSFTALVTFGDSLSDIGTYAPATSLAGNGTAPYFGGKFTVNIDGNGGKVWVENLAATMGLVVTPAELGFAGSSVKCPAKLANPALAGTCTAYGQGGARVTDPVGIGNNNGAGALTVPMAKQVANHLAAFGSFKASDLILVWGGHNDAFTQLGAFGVKAQAIQADALAGKISGDQANKLLYDAQTAAQYGMKAAALELAALVKDQILAKGGKYVAVINLIDIALSTPYGSTLPANVRPVLTTLVETFNLWLRDGLTDLPVQWVDSSSLVKDFTANPSKYGFVNKDVPACDSVKMDTFTGRATEGSSLLCNGTPGMPYNGLRAGADVNTWAFADGVHPTPGGHKVISDYVTTQLKAFGWL